MLAVVVVHVIVGDAPARPGPGARHLDAAAAALPCCRSLLIGVAVVVLATLAIALGYASSRSVPTVPGEALLVAIQSSPRGCASRPEPTWATLRPDVLSRINLQFLLGSVMMSGNRSIAVSVTVVLLYALFLLVEQHHFAGKLAHLSDDPNKGSRASGAVIGDINRRIGAYLAY